MTAIVIVEISGHAAAIGVKGSENMVEALQVLEVCLVHRKKI